MYNQGIVVYSTTMKKGAEYFKMNVHDYGLIYLDEKLIDVIDRSKNINRTIEINCKNTTCKLDIVVEAMGHINFDHQMEKDRKGLISIETTKKTTF